MRDKTFIKDPAAPASSSQCITLMRLTGKYWAEQKDGNWVGLINKGTASGMLDKLFSAQKKGKAEFATALSEVLAQHPLGENATGPAKAEPKTPRVVNGYKLPDGVSEATANELFAAFALKRLAVIPESIGLDRANKLFAAAIDKREVIFESAQERVDAISLLQAIPDNATAETIIVLDSADDAANAEKLLNKYGIGYKKSA